MLKYKTTKVIEVQDWDKLVVDTYKRPYKFQQQDGCQSRGTVHINIPDDNEEEEEQNDSIPEKINGDEMCVKFDVWLERDPKAPVNGRSDEWEIAIFWHRNFYPYIQTVANDLHAKGLIEAGEYTIDINW